MAAMNSSVLACNYVLSNGSDMSLKLASISSPPVTTKLPVIKAQQAHTVVETKKTKGSEGRRVALLFLAGALFSASTSSANASIFDEYLEKSKANNVSSICMLSLEMVLELESL